MLSTPSSLCNGLLLILLAMSPDKRYPAGLEMSLEWKHVPQTCVENDQAVICSFHCVHLLEVRGGGKSQKREHLIFCDGGTVIVKDRGTMIWGLSLCPSDFFSRLILRVKKNTKHNAGFMHACSDRVLMPGCYTMLAGNC